MEKQYNGSDVKKILGQKINSDGEIVFLVDWKAKNLSRNLIEKFLQKRGK